MVANTQGDLSINKIKRAPGLKYTIIPCPDCGAGIGERCVSRYGIEIGKGHVVRRRLVLRKLNEEGKTDNA